MLQLGLVISWQQARTNKTTSLILNDSLSQHNGRKPVPTEEGLKKKKPFWPSEAETDYAWPFLTMDSITKAGTAPMATYPSSSTNLYLQEKEKKKTKTPCEKTIPPHFFFFFVIVAASKCHACCKHLRTGVGFQVNCVELERRDTMGDGVTSHGKRRHTWILHRPWPISASACGTTTAPAPSASTWRHTAVLSLLSGLRYPPRCV